MKTEEKIKALAELDGWKLGVNLWSHPDSMRFHLFSEFNYLTSYDAIIPLCFKYWGDWFLKAMRDKATPAQLADALLVATGRMKV